VTVTCYRSPGGSQTDVSAVYTHVQVQPLPRRKGGSTAVKIQTHICQLEAQNRVRNRITDGLPAGQLSFLLRVELTRESNRVQSTKQNKRLYQHLLNDLDSMGKQATLVTIEIGSLGHYLPSCCKSLMRAYLKSPRHVTFSIVQPELPSQPPHMLSF